MDVMYRPKTGIVIARKLGVRPKISFLKRRRIMGTDQLTCVIQAVGQAGHTLSM